MLSKIGAPIRISYSYLCSENVRIKRYIIIIIVRPESVIKWRPPPIRHDGDPEKCNIISVDGRVSGTYVQCTRIAINYNVRRRAGTRRETDDRSDGRITHVPQLRPQAFGPRLPSARLWHRQSSRNFFSTGLVVVRFFFLYSYSLGRPTRLRVLRWRIYIRNTRKSVRTTTYVRDTTRTQCCWQFIAMYRVYYALVCDIIMARSVIGGGDGE